MESSRFDQLARRLGAAQSRRRLITTVLAVALPVLMLVRSEEGKRRVMTWGSLAVLAISTVWLVQRVIA